VILLFRLAGLVAFWGLAVALPGWLAGRRLTGGPPLRAMLVGAGLVLLLATAASVATHRRLGRPVIAVTGALVALAATLPSRRR
jgi:uncharacterized membrane protein